MGGITLQTKVVKRTPSDDLLIQGFVEDCKLRGLSSESIRNYRSNLKIVSRRLNSVECSLLDLARTILKRVLRYLRKERQVSSNTVDNYFCALSSFYHYLVYEGLAETNPVLPTPEEYLLDVSTYLREEVSYFTERKIAKYKFETENSNIATIYKTRKYKARINDPLKLDPSEFYNCVYWY